MDYLPPTACADDYTDALTLGPRFQADHVTVAVGGSGSDTASVLFQIATGVPGAWRWSDEREFTAFPQAFRIAGVVGIRFRNKVAGTPATVTCYLLGPKDPDIQPGTSFPAIPSSSAVLPGTSCSRSLTEQTIHNNDGRTGIAFDTVLFDDLGWFDPSDPTHITPTIAGQFLVTYTFAWVYPTGSGFPIQTGIDLDLPPVQSVVSQQVVAAAATPNATSGPSIINAVAGSKFLLYGYQASGGDMKTFIPGSEGTDIQPVPTLSVIRIGDRV